MRADQTIFCNRLFTKGKILQSPQEVLLAASFDTKMDPIKSRLHAFDLRDRQTCLTPPHDFRILPGHFNGSERKLA